MPGDGIQGIFKLFPTQYDENATGYLTLGVVMLIIKMIKEW